MQLFAYGKLAFRAMKEQAVLVHLTKIVHVMKLTALFLTAAFTHASASDDTQKINLSFRDAPLVKVFIEIQKQAGYSFVYTEAQAKQFRPVTAQVKDADIQEALTICLKNQPFTFEIINNSLVTLKPKEKISPSQANNHLSSIEIVDLSTREIRGRVVNENGDPIPQVTVTVKGTKSSTVTDSNGEFVFFDIDTEAILVFTHVSMESFELKASGKQELTVRLKAKITQLGDVTVTVSTGYQDIPKERATGSFTKVDNELLNKQVGTNILDRLNGVALGFQVITGKTDINRKLNVAVRGVSSISGPLDPLIILDNFIFEGDINNINPNDIESVTILKDAAAASIWGARASNGVIVITTKKGSFDQKLRIEFNTNLIVQKKPDLFTLPQISSADYIDVEEFIFNQGYFTDQINNTFTYPALTPAVEVFLKRQNVEISAADSATMIDDLKTYDVRNNYARYFHQNAITQQYALNLRGGNNNLAWIIAGAYDKSTGLLKNESDKVNLRFNNSYRPIKNLQLDLGVYFTTSKTKSGIQQSKITIDNRVVPYLRLADDAGAPLPVYNRYRKGYLDTLGGGYLLDWKYYPLEDYKHQRNDNTSQELIGNIGLTYQIVDGLRVSFNYQYQKQSSSSIQQSDLNSFETRYLINNFSQIDYSTGFVNYVIPKGDMLHYINSNLRSQNVRGQINLNKTWQDHSVSAIAGAEAREVVSSGNSVRYYGYIEDPLSYATIDFVNQYPTIIGGSFQPVPVPPSLSPTINNRFVSVYTNASYIFKQRYILSGSARRDASNIFGLSTNDKWNPLWSVGFAWDISREKFYNISWLPQLKLRSTFGYSGNVDPSTSALPVALYLTDPTTNFPSGRIGVLNNPSLRWEKSRQVNIGIDFASKNQRLSGSFEYFHKKGLDLYGPTPYDYTAWGYSNQLTQNIANMDGNGVEVSLQTVNVNSAFRWTTNFLFNYNTNKTTAYFSETAQLIPYLIGGGQAITPVVGKPLYAIAAYRWAGLDANGDPQGYVNGQVTTDYSAIINQVGNKGVDSGSIVYVGSALPTSFGSLINNFSWKGLSISINFAYRLGYYFVKPSFTSGALIVNGEGHKDFEKRWQKPGDESITNIPAFVYTSHPQFTSRDHFYRNAEINVLKGDHIRLQYINIGYSIDKKNSRLPFQRISLYANFSNLGILWRANDESLDPDNAFSYRTPMTFAFGLRGSF